MNKNNRKYLFAFLLILWTALILYCSLAPADELPVRQWWNNIPHFDKLAHFGFYFVEVTILILLFDLKRWGRVAILVAVIAFSAVIELLQQKYFNRSGDVLDLAANALGAVFGVGAAYIISKRSGK